MKMFLGAIMLLALPLGACASTQHISMPLPAVTIDIPVAMPERIKTKLVLRPVDAPSLPDASLTPGAVDPDLTKDKLCDKDFSTKSVRNVSAQTKAAVYKRYKISGGDKTGYCKSKEGCEVDHLISLEIGGSNDVKNLWPQSYSTSPYNAHIKDKLENRLHKEVCEGTITLEDAQHGISSDWIVLYKKYFK